MKNVMRVALALVLGLGVAPMVAWADASQGGEIQGINSDPIKRVVVTAMTSSAGDFQPGSLILGFKLYANDAGDRCTLYDAATIGSATSSNTIDEWVEATDEETNVQLWPRPYKLVTDLTVDTNGICIIYYQ